MSSMMKSHKLWIGVWAVEILRLEKLTNLLEIHTDWKPEAVYNGIFG